MKKLTLQMIINRRNFSKRIVSSTVFLFVGVCLTMSPGLALKEINANFLIGTGFCFLIFGLPFGFFWGLKKLLETLKEKKAFETMQFKIIEDTVVDMRMMGHSSRENIIDANCQLMFEKYSKVTGKNYIVPQKVFNKTNEGDVFYLVCIGGIEETIEVFNKREFCLDEQLEKLLVQ